MPKDGEHYIEYAVAGELRRLRQAGEFSQDRIGALVGVSRANVFFWESSMHTPNSLDRWQDWARALGARLDIVLTERDGTRHTF